MQVNEPSIVKEIEAAVNELLDSIFRLPERHFPNKLGDDLLFRLRALAFDTNEPVGEPDNGASVQAESASPYRPEAEPEPTIVDAVNGKRTASTEWQGDE